MPTLCQLSAPPMFTRGPADACLAHLYAHTLLNLRVFTVLAASFLYASVRKGKASFQFRIISAVHPCVCASVQDFRLFVLWKPCFVEAPAAGSLQDQCRCCCCCWVQACRGSRSMQSRCLNLNVVSHPPHSEHETKQAKECAIRSQLWRGEE